MQLLDKTSWSAADIQQLIDTHLEESVNIEFKSSGSVQHTDFAKKEMAKDISAFANSDGGIIFYGIEEKDHVASGLSFIDGQTFTKEWMENVISSNVQRKIDGLKISPVRFDDDIKRSIYVVNIPASANTPHQAKDKRFYKRYNFQSVMMEEYEVRSAYLRRQQSKLEIVNLYYTSRSLDKLVQAGVESLDFSLRLQIKNTGGFPAELYKCLVTVRINDAFGIKGNSGIEWTHLENEWQISSIQHPVLFPEEVSTPVSFDMNIEHFGFPLRPKALEIKVKLYYPGGEDTETFDLTDTINELYKKVCDAHYPN